MSSSRRSQTRGGSSNNRSSSQFPSPWSNWQWNDHWKNEYRYRQVATNGREDDWQYEYRNPEAPRDKQISPTTATETLTTISESTVPVEGYPPEPNYTFDPRVENVAEAFSRTNLVGGGQTRGQFSQRRERSNSYGQRSNSGLGATATYVDRRVRTQNPYTTVDLDPDFTIHQSWEFKFGQVFKVLWSEPTGSAGTEITGLRKSRFGEAAYHSIRRFLIVDPRKGHCICLPILTYGGQATLKKGVHAEDHAIIYTGKNGVMLQGEKLTKRAIRMIPTSERHKLDLASRINYSKVYTVEHNVRVNFVGQIAQKYEQQVVTDYNKTHRPLPDRPYVSATSEETYEYAQGADPHYSSSLPSTGVVTGSSYVPIISSWATGNTLTSGSSYTTPHSSYPPMTGSAHSYAVPEYDKDLVYRDQHVETQIDNTHSEYRVAAAQPIEQPLKYNSDLGYPAQSEEAEEQAHEFDETLYDEN